jgi:3-phosphoshikimate 1-carboxyvinyltransferase
MTRSIAYREVGGSLRAPASKSSMQRAIACALLSEGESILRYPSRSADCLAALAVARAFGTQVEDSGEAFAIRGAAPGVASSPKGSIAPRKLSCGESGLCIRMFSPIAALFEGETVLGAEGSLRRRPVGMIAPPLIALGAACETAAGLPPVRIRGPLRGGRALVDGRMSSQLLTGLLIALPLAQDDSEIEVEGLVSRGYVDLTLDTMRAFGVAAERDARYSHFRVQGSQRYRAADFRVEGDWSGAAFLLVAGAIAARGALLRIEGLDASSSQPDVAILEALRAAGARVEAATGEVSVERGRLQAFDFDATGCPDLFPPLVALAAACEGETKIRGAHRLRGKESDRAEALSREFAALGATVAVEDDLMRVRGCGLDGGGRLEGGRVDSRGDHRVAMAAAIASFYCEAAVAIVGSECVAKSWPSFFEDLASIAH